jgi:nicotinate-nucleotide adenylyltransferase
MKVGLLFGSFNPVHCGHLMIANYCLARCGLQQVWLVLSPQNPLKHASLLFPVERRMQWLRAALANYSLPIRICDAELSLPMPSYTINTMEHLAACHPQCDFSIIMGADCLAQIERWHRWQDIAAQYKIIVYPRLGADAAMLCGKYGAQFADAPIIGISSAMIRHAAAQALDLSAFVPNGVDIFDV